MEIDERVKDICKNIPFKIKPDMKPPRHIWFGCTPGRTYHDNEDGTRTAYQDGKKIGN